MSHNHRTSSFLFAVRFSEVCASKERLCDCSVVTQLSLNFPSFRSDKITAEVTYNTGDVTRSGHHGHVSPTIISNQCFHSSTKSERNLVMGMLRGSLQNNPNR